MADHPQKVPLLNLDTFTEHPSVKIDGVLYGLSPLDALSVFAFQRVRKVAPQIGRLLKKEITEDESSELETLLVEMCQILLDAPPEVRAKLTVLQQLSVYTAFLMLPRPTLLRAVGGQLGTEETSPSGAPSRRGSHGSTGARRSNGSRPSRSRSSGRASP